MKWIKNANIKKKIFLAMGCALFALIINFVAGLIFIQQLKTASEKVSVDAYIGLRELTEVLEGVEASERARLNVMIIGLPGEVYTEQPLFVPGYVDKIRTNAQEYALEGTPFTPQEQQIYDRFVINIDEYIVLLEQTMDCQIKLNDLYDAGKYESPEIDKLTKQKFELDAKARVLYESIYEDLSLLAESDRALGDKAVEDANKMANLSIIAQVVTLVLGIALTLIAAQFFSNLISKPIGMVTQLAKKFAEGDISPVATTDQQDEAGELVNAFSSLSSSMNHLTELLADVAGGDLTGNFPPRSSNDEIAQKFNEMVGLNRNVLSEIHDLSQLVDNEAQQLAQTGQHLAEGANQQSDALQKISDIMLDIVENANNNSKASNQAKEISASAESGAAKGTVSMNDMLAAMEEINTASHNISKVIKVIDDIAFQTNILALNAAVEAARAGQHGKGFAVVADEVRTLAARSAEAARETADIIQGSIEKIADGSRKAQETADVLSVVTENISETGRLVSGIAEVSQQQLDSVSAINTSIESVVQVVHSNSAMAQQSAAVTQQLSGQATTLKQSVLKYHLGDSSHTLPPAQQPLYLPQEEGPAAIESGYNW